MRKLEEIAHAKDAKDGKPREEYGAPKVRGLERVSIKEIGYFL